MHLSTHGLTSNHFLTGYSTALDQGRYSYLAPWFGITGFCSWPTAPHYNLYPDLPGHLASTSSPSTVSPSLSSCSNRPDIVLISDDHIILLELFVVTNCEEHFAAASSRKQSRYGPLVSDLACPGLHVDLVTIEVRWSRVFRSFLAINSVEFM